MTSVDYLGFLCCRRELEWEGGGRRECLGRRVGCLGGSPAVSVPNMPGCGEVHDSIVHMFLLSVNGS